MLDFIIGLAGILIIVAVISYAAKLTATYWLAKWINIKILLNTNSDFNDQYECLQSELALTMDMLENRYATLSREITSDEMMLSALRNEGKTIKGIMKKHEGIPAVLYENELKCINAKIKEVSHHIKSSRYERMMTNQSLQHLIDRMRSVGQVNKDSVSPPSIPTCNA